MRVSGDVGVGATGSYGVAPVIGLKCGREKGDWSEVGVVLVNEQMARRGCFPGFSYFSLAFSADSGFSGLLLIFFPCFFVFF